MEKYYPVVGILEELNVTLEILEHKIPYFFKGVQDVYKKQLLSKCFSYVFDWWRFSFISEVYKKKKKPKIMEVVQKKLKETLVKEYEFYEWIKSRLFRQLQIMYGEHNSHWKYKWIKRKNCQRLSMYIEKSLYYINIILMYLSKSLTYIRKKY